ncbi:NAD(P)H-binding protein [Allomuricauda sp. SCSIO 65647]|uniref:NAD(P)H-binding protein n=1 Tax=Allomuricauda sp. SCSIO 65647 TaxID=2908843 RepID=UPI001F432528|nr:NAD(P)H-binding protein [Muricauda sp. SCSIO 65647]UJH68737.1 NAD(P)H-binding protein [Muricauda sp. SCSIO 65647]
MNKSLGILGCGWLGLPLAKHLKAKGYSVRGTTTSQQKVEKLNRSGIDSFLVMLHEDGVQGQIEAFLSDMDILIVNVPPKLRSSSSGNYVDKMKHLVKKIGAFGIKHVLFVSSTSVYGNVTGEITEDTLPRPITESGRQLLDVESFLMTKKTFTTTIIRFGGLIGPNRHPVNFLSGKVDLKNGGELINLIHLDDCIYMISSIIEKEYWNEVFNGVYPYHPNKADYYHDEAKKKGLQPPLYREKPLKNSKKTIINKNFLNKGLRLYTPIAS